MAQDKRKYASPRRVMPGVKLPDIGTKAVEDKTFRLTREREFTTHTRFYMTEESNPHSGLRGFHILKLDEGDATPHGISFDINIIDNGTTIPTPFWEIGMDATVKDFILAFDHSADDDAGADTIRLSRAEDDTVSGSRSTKFNFGYMVGSPAANATCFTLLAGDTLGGINLSVSNSASGRSSITITQRDANHFGAISFDNAVRIGCDYSNADAATLFIRDDVAGAARLWMDANGQFAIGGGVISPSGQLHITPRTSGTMGVVVEGASGQTASLQEWQDSNGDAMVAVLADGTLLLNVVGGSTGVINCKQLQTSEGFRGSGQPTRFLNNTITPGSDADVTVSTPDSDYLTQVLVTGAWTAGHNVILPTVTEATYIVRNTTAFSAVFKTAAGTGVTVAAGMRAIIQCGGANYLRITADAS